MWVDGKIRVAYTAVQVGQDEVVKSVSTIVLLRYKNGGDVDGQKATERSYRCTTCQYLVNKINPHEHTPRPRRHKVPDTLHDLVSVFSHRIRTDGSWYSWALNRGMIEQASGLRAAMRCESVSMILYRCCEWRRQNIASKQTARNQNKPPPKDSNTSYQTYAPVSQSNRIHRML
jgi:hypothetical protein